MHLCKNCKNPIGEKPKKYSYKQWKNRIFCSKKCKGLFLKPKNFTNWKGGVVMQGGYIYLFKPEHPRAKNKYVKRATIILEEMLGRMLNKDELAHHINEDKLDDSPENLEVMKNSEHSKYHSKKSDLGKYIRVKKLIKSNA